MQPNLYVPLSDRALLKISGKDSYSFLQGLVTNNVEKVTETQSIYALMLTPQGKYLYDFFISYADNSLWVDCSATYKEAILKKLSLYRLRSDVVIEDISDSFEVVALLGDKAFEFYDEVKPGIAKKFCKGVAYIDPRSEKIYCRSFIERENNYQSFISHDFMLGQREDYDYCRLSQGIPDGELDILSEKNFPLDFWMDHFHAIDYEKGCYVGQEVTARVHHKGSVRKKPYILHFESAPQVSEEKVILNQDGKKIGVIGSVCDKIGLGLCDREASEKSGYQGNVGSCSVRIEEIPQLN